jgi:hypothetical protein
VRHEADNLAVKMQVSEQGRVSVCSAPCSIQCPRQDSNLRARLRSPFPGMALTCRNVLADVLPGRVPGATYLVELPVLQPRV